MKEDNTMKRLTQQVMLTLIIVGLVLTSASYALADTFTTTGSMSTPRALHTATLLPNGRVLISGGNDVSAELYDPATGVFSPTGSMSTPRQVHTATLLPNGKVLIVGGFGISGGSYGVVSSAELYDPATGLFSPTGSMSIERYYHKATLLPNGQVLITGGLGLPSGDPLCDNCYPLTTAELYDPATGLFSLTNPMSTPRWVHTATLLPNGQVLIAGGWADNLSTLSSAELYDPATGLFSPTGIMTTGRAWHTATLLLSGEDLNAAGHT
jgi:WD40 repeat protein